MNPTLAALLVTALGALPPPPETAVLRTRLFGEIVVNHKAHLARRASCVTCHGKGVVGKIGNMGAERGHLTCRGCHVDLERGPTGCRDCHIVKPREPALASPDAAGASTVAVAASATAPATGEAIAEAALPPSVLGLPSRPFAVGMGVTTGYGHEFDGRRHLTSSLELAVMFGLGKGTAGVVVGERVSAGGSAFSCGWRGAMTAHSGDRVSVDVSADLRLQWMRANLDGAGHPVTSDTTAWMPAVGGRVGVTWRQGPFGWINLAATAQTSLWQVERNYAYRMCPTVRCEGSYDFGGFSYGAALSVGTPNPVPKPTPRP